LVKAQKQAVRELLAVLDLALGKPLRGLSKSSFGSLGDRQARLELEKPHPDMNLVRTGLVQGRNNPEDVTGMAALFRPLSKDESYVGGTRDLGAGRRPHRPTARLGAVNYTTRSHRTVLMRLGLPTLLIEWTSSETN